jgi:hypothetical protein
VSRRRNFVDEDDVVLPESASSVLARKMLSAEGLRDLPPVTPLVYGLLDLDSLAVAYGQPGAYKSFLALDLALSVSTGERWHEGRAVTLAETVLYVAAEGANAFGDRIDAWNEAHGRYTDPPGFRVLPEAINLLDRNAVAALVEVVARVRPGLVVVDTLARCMVGGDENSVKDMGQAIAALDAIRAATGCCVLVVHHGGKNRDAGARGSSALLGAADTMLEVTADDRTVGVTTRKQKNHPDDARFRFTVTTFGKSVALVPGDGTSADDISGKSLDVLDVLRSIEIAQGVSFTAWTDAAVEVGISRSTVARARTRLLELGLIADETSGKGNPRYTVTGAGRSHLNLETDDPSTRGDASEVSRSQAGLIDI